MAVEAITHHPFDEEPIPEDVELVFLAGPIQGAYDHEGLTIPGVAIFTEGDPLHFANPRHDVKPDDFDYRTQTRWERKNLIRAMGHGVFTIWLPAQDPELPHREGRAYGQTTRFEAGMAYMARHAFGEDIRIVAGMEPDYKGSEKYYRDIFDELELPVYEAHADFCRAIAREINELRGQ